VSRLDNELRGAIRESAREFTVLGAIAGFIFGAVAATVMQGLLS